MNKKGFTLIELLIVVAIIGIIAAIAIPNLMVALQKSKQKVTIGDMKSIGTGIESYITDWTVAPATTPIAQTWFEPFYIKICPRVDGWGGAFAYISGGDEYSLCSGGRGGGATVIPAPTFNYICTRLDDFTNDICFSDGYFTVGPIEKK